MRAKKTRQERLSARYRDILEFERLHPVSSTTSYRGFRPVDASQPLCLIAQIQRSGGSLLAKLFDGHSRVHAYPHELYINRYTEMEWPELDVRKRPADLFTEIAMAHAHEVWKFLNFGYQKYGGQQGSRRWPYLYSMTVHREVFIEQLERSRPQRLRDIISAYMTGFFSAWLDYQQRYVEGKKLVAVFAKRHNWPDQAARFFAEYPDGYMISLIRHPIHWYGSAKPHSAEYQDIGRAVALWSESVNGTLLAKSRWPDRVVVLSFDELITDAERTMRRVSARLGIGWEKALAHPTFNGMPFLSNSSARPVEGIDSSALSRAQGNLAQSEIDYIERNALALYERCRTFFE